MAWKRSRGGRRPRVNDLRPLFRPGSIAVVGASSDPGKRGNHALRALADAGFAGRVVPVHPAGGEILGLAVAPAVTAVDAPVDLALVCTRAETVPAVLDECARAGTRAAVVLAAGFAESDARGRELQAEIRAVAARTNLRIVGPNTSGILNTAVGLNLIGIRDVRPGRLSVLSQSGNVTLAMLTAGTRRGVGFGIVAGLGNQVDVSFADCLEYLADDDGTDAIAVYAETLRDGPRFLETARRVTPRKPVVLLKGGRTSSGSRAALTHTAALTGDRAALSDGLRRAGVVEIERSDELLEIATALASTPSPKPGGIAVLTDGGGHGTLAADALHGRRQRPAPIRPESRETLRDLLGSASAVANPVDLAGAADRDPHVIARAFDILARDPGVGVVLLTGLFGGYALRFDAALAAGEAGAAEALARRARETGIGLVVHSLYADESTEALTVLRAAGFPPTPSLEAAVAAAVALAERAPTSGPAGWTEASPRSFPRPHPVSADCAYLDEPAARELIAGWGVPLVEAKLCETAEEAEHVARCSGGPVALRVVASGVSHKTEAGGVALSVSPEDVPRTFSSLVDRVAGFAREHGVGEAVRGVLLSPMLPPPAAELLVGIGRDVEVGPVLTVGAGGTEAELRADVAVRVLPADREELHSQLRELRMFPSLVGYRGRPGVDLGSLLDCIERFARGASAQADVSSVEINPLFVYGDRCVAVDVRAVLNQQEETNA